MKKYRKKTSHEKNPIIFGNHDLADKKWGSNLEKIEILTKLLAIDIQAYFWFKKKNILEEV